MTSYHDIIRPLYHDERHCPRWSHHLTARSAWGSYFGAGRGHRESNFARRPARRSPVGAALPTRWRHLSCHVETPMSRCRSHITCCSRLKASPAHGCRRGAGSARGSPSAAAPIRTSCSGEERAHWSSTAGTAFHRLSPRFCYAILSFTANYCRPPPGTAGAPQAPAWAPQIQQRGPENARGGAGTLHFSASTPPTSQRLTTPPRDLHRLCAGGSFASWSAAATLKSCERTTCSAAAF